VLFHSLQLILSDHGRKDKYRFWPQRGKIGVIRVIRKESTTTRDKKSTIILNPPLMAESMPACTPFSTRELEDILSNITPHRVEPSVDLTKTWLRQVCDFHLNGLISLDGVADLRDYRAFLQSVSPLMLV
jgi:hypothetical protein